MTPKLSGQKVRKVRRALKRLGYEKQPGRGKGSHEVYWHPEQNRYTTLSSKDGIVPTGTLKRIASDLDLSTDELMNLL